MRLMVRADNPGGRNRFIAVLQNRGLISGGFPIDGLRIDEIGEIVISQAIVTNGVITTPAKIDDAFHANIWIVPPLLGQLRAQFSGTPTGDEDQDNDLFDQVKRLGNFRAKAVVAGLKSPGGYLTPNNVLFILANTIATPRRVWA